MLVSIARMWLTWGKNEDLLIPRYLGGKKKKLKYTTGRRQLL